MKNTRIVAACRKLLEEALQLPESTVIHTAVRYRLEQWDIAEEEVRAAIEEYVRSK